MEVESPACNRQVGVRGEKARTVGEAFDVLFICNRKPAESSGVRGGETRAEVGQALAEISNVMDMLVLP